MRLACKRSILEGLLPAVVIAACLAARAASPSEVHGSGGTEGGMDPAALIELHARRGDLAALEDLVPTGQMAPERALVAAAEEGHVAIVAVLLERSKPWRIRTKEALSAAVRDCHGEVVSYLLSNGAEATEPDLTLAAKMGCADVVGLLTRHGAPVSTTALLEAAKAGNLEAVAPLVASAAAGSAALREAASRGEVDVLQVLLSAGVQASGDALFIAARNGHTGAVSLLLEHRAPLHSEQCFTVHGEPAATCGEQGQLALLGAVAGGHAATVERLLAAGASVDSGAPLHLARSLDHPAVVALLERRGATDSCELDAVTAGLGAPLILRSEPHSRAEILARLSRPDRVHVSAARQGWLGLESASWAGARGIQHRLAAHEGVAWVPAKALLPVTRQIVRAAPSESAPAVTQRPDELVGCHGDWARVRLHGGGEGWIRSGRDEPNQGRAQLPDAAAGPPRHALAARLDEAVREGNAAAVERLLAEGVPPDADTLMAAAALGSLELVELLLARGADPNALSGEGDAPRTPLNGAARAGNLSLVRRLVDAGADLDAEDGGYRDACRLPEHGCFTPLGCAMESGSPEVVRYLEQRGAALIPCWVDLGHVGAKGTLVLRAAPDRSSAPLAEVSAPARLSISGFRSGWFRVDGLSKGPGGEGGPGRDRAALSFEGRAWIESSAIQPGVPLPVHGARAAGPAVTRRVLGARDCIGPWLGVRTTDGTGWVPLRPDP